MEHVFSKNERLTLDELYSVAWGERVGISPSSTALIQEAFAAVSRALESKEAVYGLTRHLGDGRDREVTPAELADNQKRTVVTHSGTLGERLGRVEVRALMAARLRGFAHGYSGVSPETVERYCLFLNEDVTPVVRRYGSVGASDLAPLADIAHTMLGMGEVEFRGDTIPAEDALHALGVEPLVLGGKDGLGLISSNSYSIGIGTLALQEFAELYSLMELAAGFYLEAMRCNLSWLDAECSVARPFSGQAMAARRISELLAGSELFDPSVPHSLQDPLSIRSVTHLLGASLEVASTLRESLENELNSSGDNPMVSLDTRRIISTANFNPFEIALGFEQLRIVLAHIAIGSDRRIQHLSQTLWAMEGSRSLDSTLTFGFSAASAKLKALAHPVTLDLPALVRGHEDLLSGAPLAIDATRESLRLLRQMVLGEIMLAADLLVSKNLPASEVVSKNLDTVRQAFDRAGSPRFSSNVLRLLDELLAPSDSPISSLEL